ncbi:hypothetical protein GEMRC1_006214 [Eukaryota sp. GEM-RC1]
MLNLDIETIPISATDCVRCVRECSRSDHVSQRTELSENFAPSKIWSETDIINEATRCLYCKEPACQKGCPAAVNVRSMIKAAAARNPYYGGHVAFSANPLALSTSYLCECNEGQCQSTCVLNKTNRGSINIKEIQRYVCHQFVDLKIPQLPHPSFETRAERVAVVGSGPAGLSAASFLARIGFQVTVFEKNSFAGGLLATQIPPHRLPRNVIEQEVRLVKDLGVHFIFNKEVSQADLTDFDAVFMGIGASTDILPRFNLVKSDHVQTSSAFLSSVNTALRKGTEVPDLTGKRVVVLGSGNSAIDCAEVAYRCGAEHVTMTFRKEFNEIRASWDGVTSSLREGVEFMPCANPVNIETRQDNSLNVVCERMMKSKGKYIKTDDVINVSADIVIVAFGTSPHQSFDNVDRSTGRVGESNVFVGGDAFGSWSVVEAVNDARTAAASIYSFLTGQPLEAFPSMWTPVEAVDLSTTVDGLKYPNPFLISSAPISLTYDHIKASFDAGFGGAVTKTITLNSMIHVENAVRINKLDYHNRNTGWSNLCMITDHTVEQWVDWVRKLKAEYPNKVLIASIMCPDDQKAWEELAIIFEKAGADALELNLSCPNKCSAGSSFADDATVMAMALGKDPDAVKRITQYVSAVVSIPVYTKLTPNVGELDEFAYAAKMGIVEGKLGGVTFSNTFSGLASIMPNGLPWPQVGVSRKMLDSYGISGTTIRPLVLAGLVKIRGRLSKEELTVLGVGGVESAWTALQLIHAGANVVQVCSAVQLYDYSIVREFIAGLQFFCSPTLIHVFVNWNELSAVTDAPVPSVADRVSKVMESIVGRDDLEGPEQWFSKAKINPDLCIGCGSCSSSCDSNGGIAIQKKGTVYVVDEDKCIGCALCSLGVCSENAIDMVEVAPLKL